MRGGKKGRKRYLYISLHREVIIMWLVIPTYLTVTQSLNLTLASVVQIYLYIILMSNIHCGDQEY